MNYGIIYCVENLVNHKKYVGQTINILCQRKRQHLREAFNGCSFALHRALRKYGSEKFAFYQIDEAFSLDELNQKEVFWIKALHTFKDDPECWGYNLTKGAEKGWEVSEETREKMSRAHKGKQHKPLTVEGKANISKGRKGKMLGTQNHFYGYKHPPHIQALISKKKSRCVICIETGEIYDSIKSTPFHNVSRACRDSNKTSGGYHWKYG